ncbi:MAG TPA: hypothetical protein VLF15_05745, partial [Pseudoxanthomonas sp.]|nr:hypothetical protein [Pseudoxanthomonas sp.]
MASRESGIGNRESGIRNRESGIADSIGFSAPAGKTCPRGATARLDAMNPKFLADLLYLCVS